MTSNELSDELSSDNDCPHCGTDCLEAHVWVTADEEGGNYQLSFICTRCDFDSRYDDIQAQPA